MRLKESDKAWVPFLSKEISGSKTTWNIFRHKIKGSRTIAPEENCPPPLPPSQIIVPRTIAPEENCPLAIKFPPKIIAPLKQFSSKSTTSELKSMHCLGVQ